VTGQGGGSDVNIVELVMSKSGRGSLTKINTGSNITMAIRRTTTNATHEWGNLVLRESTTSIPWLVCSREVDPPVIPGIFHLYAGKITGHTKHCAEPKSPLVLGLWETISARLLGGISYSIYHPIQ